MGNPTSWKGQARTFNLNNQETTGGATQFAYDGNGNPTTYKGSTFAFNENDKLTQITTAGTVRLQAGYRSDGLRAWKSTANGTTYFLYDGDQLVCELDAAGNLATTNIWGANGLLARQNGTSTGSISYFLWDDRGNIAQLLGAPGNVIVKFTVTAWGERVSDQGSQGSLDAYLGLGGQYGNYLDRETGLTLCGQRYYDASAGRWLNRDPIGTAGGLNVYGYVGNNPTNAVDPSGLKPIAKIFVGDIGLGSRGSWDILNPSRGKLYNSVQVEIQVFTKWFEDKGYEVKVDQATSFNELKYSLKNPNLKAMMWWSAPRNSIQMKD